MKHVHFGWRMSLCGVALFALASSAAAAPMTVDEAVAISKKSGKPILTVVGSET
jgi:hypothetical protein